MLQQASAPLIWGAAFTTNGVGTTGLTVNVDVVRVDTSLNVSTTTDLIATEAGLGLYVYAITADAGGPYAYFTRFRTTDTNVDQKNLYGIFISGLAWVEDVDAAVSTRATQAQILSDATPFPGAYIDAAISSRSDFDPAVDTVENVNVTVSVTDTVSISSASITSIATSVWSASIRTLTMTAAQIQAAISGSAMTIHRGDTFTEQVTVSDTTGWVTMDFMIKRSLDDADSASVLWVRLTNGGDVDDGLQVLNGSTSVTAADASLSVDDSTHITPTLAADITADLATEDGLFFEFQMITASAVTTVGVGSANIDGDVVRLTSA